MELKEEAAAAAALMQKVRLVLHQETHTQL